MKQVEYQIVFEGANDESLGDFNVPAEVHYREGKFYNKFTFKIDTRVATNYVEWQKEDHIAGLVIEYFIFAFWLIWMISTVILIAC